MSKKKKTEKRHIVGQSINIWIKPLKIMPTHTGNTNVIFIQ